MENSITIPYDRVLITCCKKDVNGATVYQWLRNDGVPHSPVMYSESDAKEYPDKFGLVPLDEFPIRELDYLRYRVELLELFVRKTKTFHKKMIDALLIKDSSKFLEAVRDFHVSSEDDFKQQKP